MKASLLGQLMLTAAMSVGLALLIAGLLIQGLLASRQIESTRHTMALTERRVALALVRAPQYRRPPLSVRHLVAKHDGLLSLYDSQHRALWSIGLAPSHSHTLDLSAPDLQAVLLGDEVLRQVSLDGQTWLVRARAVLFKQGGVGALVWALPLRPSPLVGRVFGQLFWAGVLGMALALVIFGFLTMRLLKPLRQLEMQAERVALGDFRPQARPGGPSELLTLWNRFNDMREQLAERVKREQAFLSNIAHELRTPLTALRGVLHALRDGLIPLANQGQYLQRSIAEVDRLGRLVGDLLQLQASKEGAFSVERERVDVARLFVDAALEYEATASEKRLQVALDASPEALWMMGDADRLHQLFGNLLENAVRHTSVGGALRLSCQGQDARTIVIEIENQGAPLDEDALKDIWQRFYRGQHLGGTGLGLSIAKIIVQHHQGQITVQNGATGPCFRVCLPRLVQNGAPTAS